MINASGLVHKEDRLRGGATVLNTPTYDNLGAMQLRMNEVEEAKKQRKKSEYDKKIGVELEKTNFDRWEPFAKLVDDGRKEYIKKMTQMLDDARDKTGDYSLTPQQQRELNNDFNGVYNLAKESKVRESMYDKIVALVNADKKGLIDVQATMANAETLGDHSIPLDLNKQYVVYKPQEEGLTFKVVTPTSITTGIPKIKYNEDGSVKEDTQTKVKKFAKESAEAYLVATVKKGDLNILKNELVSSLQSMPDDIKKKYIDKNGDVDYNQYIYDLKKGDIGIDAFKYPALSQGLSMIKATFENTTNTRAYNPPKNGGGLNITFNGGGRGSNKNISYESTYGENKINQYNPKTGDIDSVDATMPIMNITYKTNFNGDINYTGGYFNTAEGKWESGTAGKKVHMKNPNVQTRLIPVENKEVDKSKESAYTLHFVDEDKAVPITKASLLSWARNKSVNVSIEDAKKMLIDYYKSSSPKVGNNDDVELRLNSQGVYYPHIIKKESSSSTQSKGSYVNTKGKVITAKEYNKLSPFLKKQYKQK